VKEKRFLAKLTDKDSTAASSRMETRQHPSGRLMQVTFEQAHHTGELIALLWQIDVDHPR